MKKVDPALVTIDSAGFATRDIFVRLPKDVIADDLKESTLWHLVQQGNKALRKFDRLTLVAFDESWVMEALVAHADGQDVVLAKPRKTDFPARVDKLFNDGTYAVDWDGAGYYVRRIRDGAKMSDVFANAAIAERALVNMYPKRA